MDHARGAPLHPQTQGKIERWHQPHSAVRAGGCAAPTGFAASAGAEAAHALTFKSDHPMGADHPRHGCGRPFSPFGSLSNFMVLMFPPDWGDTASLWRYTKALAETVAIALLGTLLAVTIAMPLSIIAARNTTVLQFLRFVTRRGFDTLRGVDTLIWALIWINVVGLGPFAGVLAIATSDIGSFGKLFSEAIEASDRRPVEDVVSAGRSRLHAIRFGILPQVAPVLISQFLYYFESNTRSATIIGIVGAGGIGLQLSEQIRALEWQTVCFIIIMILVTVSAIDMLSTRIRIALIGKSVPPV
jgi:phosphonate transport system permease protein